MAIRQSVLALFGAINEGLLDAHRNHDPETAEQVRQTVRESLGHLGITGSAGERGWYGELFRYFDKHRTGDEPVTSPPLDEVRTELTSLEETLPPTWASRAVDAAFVLDQLSALGVGPARDSAPLLIPVLAAAPAPGEGFNGTGTVGPEIAAELAEQLARENISTREGLRARVLASGVLDSAAATEMPNARLRKVKGEYCAVVTTEAEWPDISFNRMKNVIEPVNWNDFYEEFFCEMNLRGHDPQGWTRILEQVSGDCSRYKLTTGLRFWKALRPKGLFLNYDLDPDRTDTDALVLVDNGYIWIEPLEPVDLDNGGIKVYTSKQLLISGMSATAMTNFAASLGWATNASDMFHQAAKFPPAGAAAFALSAPGKPAVEDTSTTWPVIVPDLGADLRDEMCRDTTDILKERLDIANSFAADFGARWEDGIDLADFNHLADRLGTEVTDLTKDAFQKATENFRPKAPTPQGP